MLKHFRREASNTFVQAGKAENPPWIGIKLSRSGVRSLRTVGEMDTLGNVAGSLRGPHSRLRLGFGLESVFPETAFASKRHFSLPPSIFGQTGYHAVNVEYVSSSWIKCRPNHSSRILCAPAILLPQLYRSLAPRVQEMSFIFRMKGHLSRLFETTTT
jgi:hypothetical protein